jgi:oligoendopeptidase F
MLSQGEEILDEKRSHAILSFRRLYDETLAKTRIPFTLEGKKQDFSLSSFSPILSQHPDRKVREKATKAYTKAITENSSLYQLILNTLLYNTSLTNEIRSYSYPQESTFLSYEITPKIIEALSSAISSHYEICQRFYRAKAKILHLSTLYEWDRYSTIYPEAKHADISFSDAKSLVLSSFSSFSETFHNIASGFFEGNYIDSILKDGKQSGAFCSYITPHLHPYILTNYANRLEDVTTLAHELGHGIHGVLASGNPYFEFYPSTAIAEIASIFGESLVFDRLYSHESDPKQKINLLATKLQNSFATVFRQHAFYLFELDIQNSRKENGEISLQDFSRFYLSRLQAMFGDSLILTPEHGSWWMTVGHFFRYNFYVISISWEDMSCLFSSFISFRSCSRRGI